MTTGFRLRALTGFVALALATLPSARGRAQSFYAFNAVLVPAAVPTARIARTSFTLRGWKAPERARVRYADASLELSSVIALDHPSTRVVLGVGRRTRLATGGPWRAWMLRGAWAPLRRGANGGSEIAVPEELPFASAVLTAHAPGANGTPETAFEHIEPARGCYEMAGTELRAMPSADAPRWEVPRGASVQRRARSGAWTSYDVRVGGFEVRGYVERELDVCGDVAHWIAPVGVLQVTTRGLWCPHDSTLEARVVPRGTALFVPGSASSVRLGRTRRELIARRIDERVLELRDNGPNRWVIRAEVGRPVDELEPTIGTWTADYDSCHQEPPDWP